MAPPVAVAPLCCHTDCFDHSTTPAANAGCLFKKSARRVFVFIIFLPCAPRSITQCLLRWLLHVNALLDDSKGSAVHLNIIVSKEEVIITVVFFSFFRSHHFSHYFYKTIFIRSSCFVLWSLICAMCVFAPVTCAAPVRRALVWHDIFSIGWIFFYCRCMQLTFIVSCRCNYCVSWGTGTDSDR